MLCAQPPSPLPLPWPSCHSPRPTARQEEMMKAFITHCQSRGACRFRRAFRRDNAAQRGFDNAAAFPASAAPKYAACAFSRDCGQCAYQEDYQVTFVVLTGSVPADDKDLCVRRLCRLVSTVRLHMVCLAGMQGSQCTPCMFCRCIRVLCKCLE